MKILLTGATGYVGSRLLPHLLEQNHDVVALVRNPDRFKGPSKVKCLVGDLLNPPPFPKDINAAYYLVHSMGDSASSFGDLEEKCARNFLLLA